MPSSTSTAPRRRTAADRVDAVVVGAGFGGLSAALTLAEMGARVVVCETLSYAGGCASTFGHRGYRFEAGATLFSGFAEGQLFRRLIDHHGIDVTVDWLDPVVEMRTPGFELAIPPDRSRLLQRFLALAGAPREGLRAFFAHQERVASMLWGLLDEPDLLPPHSLAGWLRQLPRARGFGPLLRDVGRPLSAVAERFGVWDWQPLRTYLDAVCQITVQCPAREAEAPFALGTLDYFFRGTGHVRGGIGQLAQGMVEAIERAGGRVRFTDRVSALEPRRGSVLVRARRGDLQARAV
ncbi:MAG: FAD-dependent oxidoreductase, partial [Holophagales bacterium]|nr:FAD-dependent oxidoreductase [Holophagales bacterium]